MLPAARTGEFRRILIDQAIMGKKVAEVARGLAIREVTRRWWMVT